MDHGCMTHHSSNIDTVLDSFQDLWNPRILTQVNDWDVRLVKVQGAFVWHSHADTDELFIVLDGTLDIGIREDGVESVVHLERYDTFVVPRGIEHRPQSHEGATLMLFDPTGTLTTGDYDGDIPDHITSTTGVALNGV